MRSGFKKKVVMKVMKMNLLKQKNQMIFLMFFLYYHQKMDL